jgi:hypothetical protein
MTSRHLCATRNSNYDLLPPASDWNTQRAPLAAVWTVTGGASLLLHNFFIFQYLLLLSLLLLMFVLLLRLLLLLMFVFLLRLLLLLLLLVIANTAVVAFDIRFFLDRWGTSSRTIYF